MDVDGYAINVIFIILLDILSSVSVIHLLLSLPIGSLYRLYLLRNDVALASVYVLVPKTLSFSPYSSTFQSAHILTDIDSTVLLVALSLLC